MLISLQSSHTFYSSQDASVLSEHTENCGDVLVVGPCCKSQLVDETGLQEVAVSAGR